jgi:hypothetical protein
VRGGWGGVPHWGATGEGRAWRHSKVSRSHTRASLPMHPLADPVSIVLRAAAGAGQQRAGFQALGEGGGRGGSLQCVTLCYTL